MLHAIFNTFLFLDIDALTAHFEKLLKEKDERIAELESKLSKKKPMVDPEIKEKANAEVHELYVIKNRLLNLKRISDVQYVNLVQYTDPETAIINPRGASIEERRQKITDAFQAMWKAVRGEDKVFTLDDFPQIMKYIMYLIKDGKKEKKDSQDEFTAKVLSF